MKTAPSTVSAIPLLIAPLCVVAATLQATSLTVASAADPAVAVVFEEHVQPILQARCGHCHSRTVRKGDLDLSSMSALRRGGESGEPAIAESLDDSLLWVMIDGGSMPPAGEPALSAGEKERIRNWILGGAASSSASEPADSIDQHDVIPIVLLRCVTCHGARLQRGGLDLRTPASMRTGGDHGPALIAGDPDASPMIQRIESHACPPGDQLLKYFIRRPSDSEVATLRDWIAAGAPESETTADVATTEPDPLVTDEDRKHWAYQPPQTDGRHTSIDGFIQEGLASAGLKFSPEADRDTLIRRAWLDLTGMPPTLEEWRHWHSTTDPRWYAAMIDHLLASPRYGERWGRYWLDVAGYADSEGGVSADPIREVAWKYRDYVVDSFNKDTPYDRFLLEQIAGDELADYAHASVITDDTVNNLVATGFLRMGIDQTGSRTMNYVPERIGVINDAIAVLGSGVLGLTLECARCHSHKYDAIPQRDYYRLKAVFQGAFDEHDWLTFKNRTLSVATPEHRQQVETVNPPLLVEIRKLEQQQRKAVATVQTELLKAHYPQMTAADHQAALAALKVADNIRTQPQRILVEQLQTAELLPDADQPESVLRARAELQALNEQLMTIRRQLVPPLEIRALWDRGAPSPTYVLRRGEHDKPGQLVGPGIPSVLTDGRTPFDVVPPFAGEDAPTGRRLALARWLTQPDHPLTARVMVNRLWYHHFGAGLVRSLENFGVKGDRPSHPELLDWLAVQFVEHGWSLKHLHRLVMNSKTYRQSSRVLSEAATVDPHNRLLSHMAMRRMDAEAVHDSLLLVSGSLDPVPGGPPDAVSVDREGHVQADPTSPGKWRRSLYTQYRRTEMPTVLELFDYPEMGPNCVNRSVSTVSPQSLLMLNNRHIHDLAAALAAEVKQAASETGSPDDPAKLITAVYQTALSRMPAPDELELGTRHLQELNAHWNGDTDAALVTYCHTILNSAAFIYID